MEMLLKTAALFLIWLILSGTSHPLHVGLGLVASFVVAWLNAGHADSPFRLGPALRMLWYLPWLFGRIVQSSLHVTALILHPALPIAPTLIHYQTRVQSQAAIVLLGNSITLTPGTITCEANEQEVVVHALDEESGHDLTTRRLEQQVARVFQVQTGSE